jgi:protein translocase SecG subunit
MTFLDLALIIVSIGLVAAILLQNRSAGLGGAFGGGEGFYVRRGSEKKLYQTTVVLALTFVAIVAVHLFIN